jgi:hypothetical protein
MDAAQILSQMAEQHRLPVEAIRAAEADRASAVPIFLDAIEHYISAGGDRSTENALFLIFHVLGAWREKAAYRPLARLLRRPADDLYALLGDASTETAHRVMAAVYDGDPEPLYAVILDREADEFVRSRMCETLAMVTLRGELPREEAARFLRACYTGLEQEECFVWQGWQSAVAMLGLAELKPLVAHAFARDFISLGWLGFEDFEADLRAAIDDPDGPPDRGRGDYTLFGDVVEELADWRCFAPEEPKRAERDALQRPKRAERDAVRSNPLSLWGVPATNPWRDVGRNDPCPCGSGRKFKKCCLAAEAGQSAA